MSKSDFYYVVPSSNRYRQVSSEGCELLPLLDELTAGRPLSKQWKPPNYSIRGTETWPDWMAFFCPLLSKRALLGLKELVTPHCELIPWIDSEKRRYTLLNVLTTIPLAHWSCEKSSSYDGSYASADVISLRDIAVPDLFRLEGYSGKTFVSSYLAQRSVSLGLRGAAFVHPSIPALDLSFFQMRFGRAGTGFISLK